MRSLYAAEWIDGAGTKQFTTVDEDSGTSTRPMVLLLHGLGGTVLDMTDPMGGPPRNTQLFDARSPVPGVVDLGWHATPPSGPYQVTFTPDAPAAGRSWRVALAEHGFGTASYSQVAPRGLLDDPVRELHGVVRTILKRASNEDRAWMLVASSRGGLLARRWLADLPPADPARRRLRCVVTLHSPHGGTSLADHANLVAAILRAHVPPHVPARVVVESYIADYLSQPALQELALGSAFLQKLAVDEQHAESSRVAFYTYGGTSPRLTRVWSRRFTVDSYVPQWVGGGVLPRFRWRALTEHVTTLADGVPELGSIAAEMVDGLGDLLVTDARSRLPWAVGHVANPLSHTESLLHPGLQQQVLGVLLSLSGNERPLPDEGVAVRYGDRMKLVHSATGMTLHSHAVQYSHPGTSGQQQVTGFPGDDDNDWWLVVGPAGAPPGHRAGQPVVAGDVLRLQHLMTRRMLHSHAGLPSPLTAQQEVTCYDSGPTVDTNDDWRVEPTVAGGLATGPAFRLVHVPTAHALHSHSGHVHPVLTAGQQEVTGFAGRDDNDLWQVLAVTAHGPGQVTASRMRATIAPYPVAVDRTRSYLVTAWDRDTGQPVAGIVEVDGKHVAGVGAQFSSRMSGRHDTHYDHERGEMVVEIRPPTVTVRASGYTPVDVDVGVVGP